jgi:hypothetical protein
VFAAYRAQAPEPLDRVTDTDWPHSEVPRLHTALAAVACLAATLLCTAELVRHHGALAVVLLVPLITLAGTCTARLAAELRAAPARSSPPGAPGRSEPADGLLPPTVRR